MNCPHITVIVCTLNRAQALRAALQSLAALTTNEELTYEVLVVDNGSTDNTSDMVTELVGTYPVPLRAVREEHRGVARARNRGILEAKSDWLAFFDDDQRADEQWLVALWRMAQKHRSPIVGGAVRVVFTGTHQPSVSPECLGIFSSWIEAKEPCRYPPNRTPGTGNVLLHRSVFERVGLFDATILENGEDMDLFRRARSAGLDAWFTPEAMIDHLIPHERLEPTYLRKVSWRVGRSYAVRDQQRWGRVRLATISLLRIFKSMALTLPRWAWHRVCRDVIAAQGDAIAWWRNCGYLSGARQQLFQPTPSTPGVPPLPREGVLE